jgi:hypothetical protein
MDTSREIIYRGFTLNPDDGDLALTGGGAAGSGITGCKVDSFDMSDVDVVQWTEKRAQADGNDAGDVFLGPRRIRMAGTLYGLTRPALFDQLWDLRAALNPVLAQREEPLDKGYRPLYFTVPTERVDDYPEGIIELQVKALPRAFQQVTRDDESGGDDDDSLAIPWQATFLCRDPGIFSADPITVNFDATSSVTGTTGANATNLFTKASHGLVAGDRITFSAKTGGTGLSLGVAYYVISSGLTSSEFKLSLTSGGAEIDFTTDVSASTWVKSSTAAGTWTNRGKYLGSMNMLVEVGAGAGTISATVGDSVFTVTVPASTVNRIIRVAADKTVTFEENAVETTQMGAIAFTGDTTYPLIDPGDTPYSVTFHGMSGVVTGSRMWFYEQYA